MALIHETSKPSVCSEIDLFSLPPTDTSIDTSYYADYKSIVNIQDANAKLEFRIQGSPNHYLDPSDSFIVVKLKVVKSDGSDLSVANANANPPVVASNVSVVNCLLHSLFSQCEVFLANQLVSSSNNCYAYKAYLESLLKCSFNHSIDIVTALLKRDTNNFSLDDHNEGYRERSKEIAASKTVELVGKLFFPLAFQKRFILNDTPMTVTLTRNSDKFCILAPTDEYKIKITDATFFIRKHVLYPSITMSHQKLLELGNTVKYPFIGSDVQFFTIPKGNQNFLQDNIFQGQIPARVFICMVLNAAFIGDFTKNPYKFELFHLSKIHLTVNSLSIPMRPLSIGPNSTEIATSFYLLNKCVQKINEGTGTTFTLDQYKEGYTIFGFDICPLDLTESTMYLEKSGDVKLEVSFSSPLDQAVTLLVYSEHQKVLEIDRLRQITLQ